MITQGMTAGEGGGLAPAAAPPKYDALVPLALAAGGGGGAGDTVTVAVNMPKITAPLGRPTRV